MKASELTSKTVDELKNLAETKKIDLAKLKFKHAMGQLEKTADLKKLRREIAAISTIAHEKELAKVK